MSLKRKRSARPRERTGSVLLTVLGTVVTATAIVLVTQRIAISALHVARNRVAVEQARWNAENCVSRIRAAWTEAATQDVGQLSWARLDSIVDKSPLLRVSDRCGARMRAVGSRIDVNTADDSTLRALFAAVGTPASRAESLTAAVLDWRDLDVVPRPAGAETQWYKERGLPLPANRDLRSRDELRRIRGLEDSTSWAEILDVEPGRVSVSNASAAVLLSLPGSSTEFVREILRQRDAGTLTTDFSQLGEGLYPADRVRLWGNMDQLIGVTAIDPDSWVVEARGWANDNGVVFVLEVLLARDGEGTRVIRRREWLE